MTTTMTPPAPAGIDVRALVQAAGLMAIADFLPDAVPDERRDAVLLVATALANVTAVPRRQNGQIERDKVHHQAWNLIRHSPCGSRGLTFETVVSKPENAASGVAGLAMIADILIAAAKRKADLEAQLAAAVAVDLPAELLS